MQYVHISANIERRIEDLKNDGKAGRAVARRTAAVIKSLVGEGVGSYVDGASGFTRYGEKRIRNCRKYELGCGYRLITLQRGVKVFVVFLGTHDECHRWLKNHRRLKKYYAGNGEVFRIFDATHPSAGALDADPEDSEEDPEEALLASLTDQDLRRVFRGLVEGARKRSRKTLDNAQKRT